MEKVIQFFEDIYKREEIERMKVFDHDHCYGLAHGYNTNCHSLEEVKKLTKEKRIDLFTKFIFPPDPARSKYMETADKRVEFPGSSLPKRKPGSKGRNHGDMTSQRKRI